MAITSQMPNSDDKSSLLRELAALSPTPLPKLPPDFVIRAVMGLRRLLYKVADALAPPEVKLYEQTTGILYTQLIGAAARHRIPDLLSEGPLHTSEIAARLGTDPDATHRMMRALSTLEVFVMHDDGRCENGRLAQALRSGTSAAGRDFAEYFASASNCAAWCDFERTLQTGKNAFARVHGMSVWDWFDQQPHERETFARAMMGMTLTQAPTIATLYPWKQVQRVCDIGGGRGTLLSEILVRHPHLRGILCDGAGVIESAKSLLQRRGVLDRVELVPGSFFDQVPTGADAYVLKHVLHDWDDARSHKILSVCRKAMQPGNRVLLIEGLLERNVDTDLGTLADMQMMVVTDEGRERSRAELRQLLEASGFRPGRIFPSFQFAVIEGIASEV